MPILEAVSLNVRSGMQEEFEAAFRQASPLISSIDGHLSHELHRCIETTGRYLLLVTWRNLEDHTIGFRQSPQYQTWKGLLHKFYEPFPTVEHYERIEL